METQELIFHQLIRDMFIRKGWRSLRKGLDNIELAN